MTIPVFLILCLPPPDLPCGRWDLRRFPGHAECVRVVAGLEYVAGWLESQDGLGYTPHRDRLRRDAGNTRRALAVWKELRFLQQPPAGPACRVREFREMLGYRDFYRGIMP